MIRSISIVVFVFFAAAAVASSTAETRLDVPYVSQPKNGCGAASISMVLQYWHQTGHAPLPIADTAGIMRQLYSKDAKGIFASDMERFVRDIGFQSFAFKGEWQDLEHHLSRGRPLIVSLKEGIGATLHYVVVAGVSGEVVFLNDPARGKSLKMQRGKFEKRWNAARSWTLLALPPGRPAAMDVAPSFSSVSP